MAKAHKRHAPHCAKQFRLWSIKFGEKRGRSNGGHSKPRPRVKSSISRFKSLQPSNDIQRGLKPRITEVALELAEARLLLFSHLGSSIPFPFLAVLLLWITILFAGFSLMAPPSPVTLASLVVCALSVSAAIFLILGLDEPFFGLMAIQSEPLKNALPPLTV